MFDIGWFELLILMALAVIVVGPKDLPKMMTTVGRYVARARSMAAEFQRGFEDLAKETELEELKREIDRVGEGDILSSPPPIRPNEDEDAPTNAAAPDTPLKTVPTEAGGETVASGERG
ncbi:Sec-independent protein translocase protein TatB [Pyruvatibacter sp.]